VILLTEVSQPSDVAAIADKVVAAIGSLGPVGGQELPMTTSVGIALYPDDGEDAATLIDHADSAMYHAKTHRLGSFFFQRMVPARERSLETQARVSRRRSAADYERALAEQERRNAQLSEANEQLVLTSLGAQALQAAAEQAQRRQTKFMAVVARELRDPLAPIRIATAMLGLPRTDELLLPRAQALIERQLANLSRLVGELVDGSRTETGALILERKSVDMAGLIGETVDACRPALNARQQRIDVDLPAGPLEVQGDRARLAQVLGNLLDNASKYTPDGGAIGLSVAVTGKALAVTVSDNGIGIVAQALPHIFEPFVQDARASGLHGTGLGLGLTVVRELVEAHGGTVTARSAGSGLGSQFVVTLPLA